MTRRARRLLWVVAIAGVFGLATVSPARASITLVIAEGSSTQTLNSAGSTLTFSGLSTTDYTGISGTVTMANSSINSGTLTLNVSNATNVTGSTNKLSFDASSGYPGGVPGTFYRGQSTISGTVLAGPSGTTGGASETLTSTFTSFTQAIVTQGPNFAPPAAGASSFPTQSKQGPAFQGIGSYGIESVLTFTTSGVGDSVSGQGVALATILPEPAALSLFVGGAGVLLLARRARRRKVG